MTVTITPVFASAGFATPEVDEETRLDERLEAGRPWQTVVWNDPVNLMSYVVRVFREYFGYSAERATELMLAVHHDGHAVVSEGAREQMELHAQAMHDYGLWATVRKASA
ncbi:ATP-dependent Clp protease adapter ClpS [Microbacterium sp. NPDC096154]|uniref:ATP-dependent Clp protease adapter ClpS n=1 Tax=Microbacterium sp. NPDC096154 TaxID=3155549 RepID=UPI00331AE7E2